MCANPIPGANNKAEYTANKPGRYTANLSLKLNPATTCTADAHLNAIPCKSYDTLACGTPVSVSLPNTQAAGVALAPGDKFTAGDYTVVITNIISGDPAGYIGTGYVEMRLVAEIVAKKIAVDFTNLVVNDCYEMAGGSVVTQYDPNWGGVLDVDEMLGLDDLLQKLIETEKELLDFLPVYSGSDSDNQKFDKLISDLNTINDKIQNSTEYDAATKASVQTEIDGLIGNAYCLTNKAPPNGRISALNSNCTFTPWTALAQCIGGAVVGVFVEYSMKWLELIADNNPKHFVNDFTYIRNQLEWNSIVKSAAIGCVFAALPLPTNKVAAALVGAGALEGATEGFATNIINQYNSLKDNHPLIDIPEHIQWQSAFADAATQGMSQAILMLITRNIGQSQKIQSLGRLIVQRANTLGPEVYRAKLKLASLSDEVINALYAKLGIPVIKKLPNLAFKPFNHYSYNYRYNLALLTGRVLSQVTEQAHHVFSQGDQFLVPHWNRLGINVHDPRFMQWWPKPGHQQNDYAYRQMWRAYFDLHPNANINQVYAKGKEIMAHFGFTVLY